MACVPVTFIISVVIKRMILYDYTPVSCLYLLIEVKVLERSVPLKE